MMDQFQVAPEEDVYEGFGNQVDETEVSNHSTSVKGRTIFYLFSDAYQ